MNGSNCLGLFRGLVSRLAWLVAVAMAVAPIEAGAAYKPDWSRVQALSAGRKTVVVLYDDRAPAQGVKVRGRFGSATADSVTLLMKDGQSRTLQRADIHKVRVVRPVGKRWPAWVALAVTVPLAEILQTADVFANLFDEGEAASRWVFHAAITAPVTLGILFAMRMATVYEVPAQFRSQ